MYPQRHTRYLAQWLAGQIPNPVLRLRYLQAFVPLDQAPPRISFKFCFSISFVVVSLLLTEPVSSTHVEAVNAAPRPLAGARLAPARVRPTVRVEQTPEIWLVERTEAFEIYSNGLRIDNEFSVANHPRSYLAFPAARPEDTRGERRSVPAGIVFHTTESLQAPFESRENSKLKRIGESLLAYIKLKRSYNFVIDRFGRVYRVVREEDAANHAGSSIWSDPDWLYLNLNESFLGVSFETQTLPGQVESAVNPAQVRAAAMLTDMLRKRYGIPAGNCVTHAQVSVNASSLRIGYHLDWASSFPFDQLGLPDNYALALPSVSLFGFEYDTSFARLAGVRMYQEARLAEQQVRDGAGEAHVQVAVYRKALQRRYRKRLAAVTSSVE